MDLAVSKRFLKLEALRKEAFELLGPHSDETVNKPEAQGKWGAVQHLAHILNSETAGLTYMKKKTGGASGTGEAGFMGSIRLAVLRFALSLPVKFKAPPLLSEPDSHISKDVFFLQWETLRKEYESFLGGIDSDLVHLKLYKHPAVGYMSIVQALDFMAIHLERHIKSARIILKDA
jgi:hypothetical protein